MECLKCEDCILQFRKFKIRIASYMWSTVLSNAKHKIYFINANVTLHSWLCLQTQPHMDVGLQTTHVLVAPYMSTK